MVGLSGVGAGVVSVVGLLVVSVVGLGLFLWLGLLWPR